MDHQVEVKGDCSTILISGDIDLACSDEVRDLLLNHVVRSPLTLVEMSGVTLIDSSGIASLLDGRETAKKRGHQLELLKPSPQVMRVLGLAQLDKVFIIRQD